MSTSGLYFIAIVIPEPFATDIRAFQHYTAEHFSAKHALRSPPHITLIPPFRMDRQSLKTLTEVVRGHCSKWPTSNIHLRGFGHFENRVIYVDVMMEDELIEQIGELNQMLRKAGFGIREEQRAYNPHVTIAFRDLVPEEFQGAFAHFDNIEYAESFLVKELGLLMHTGQNWMIRETIPMFNHT
jgi:2'-5' RNA ligase